MLLTFFAREKEADSPQNSMKGTCRGRCFSKLRSFKESICGWTSKFSKFISCIFSFNFKVLTSKTFTFSNNAYYMFHLYASTYIDSICTVLILSVIKLSISLNHHLLIYIFFVTTFCSKGNAEISERRPWDQKESCLLTAESFILFPSTLKSIFAKLSLPSGGKGRCQSYCLIQCPVTVRQVTMRHKTRCAGQDVWQDKDVELKACISTD